MAFLKFDEFLKQVRSDKGRLCACGCGKSLEPRVDGERNTIEGEEVNSDCYYKALGKEIDERSIGAARKLRP